MGENVLPCLMGGRIYCGSLFLFHLLLMYQSSYLNEPKQGVTNAANVLWMI